MAADTRCRNYQWRLNLDSQGMVSTSDAQLAVLMDIRDELKQLNSLLHCSNFTQIPSTLRSIRRAIPTRRKRVKS